MRARGDVRHAAIPEFLTHCVALSVMGENQVDDSASGPWMGPICEGVLCPSFLRGCRRSCTTAAFRRHLSTVACEYSGFSSARSAPVATLSRAFSATATDNPTVAESTSSMPVRSEPPPVITIPFS